MRRHRALASLLLTMYAAMALLSIRGKSATFDEVAHLTAGYSYWLPGDFRFNPEIGTLAQSWASLPLLVVGPTFPETEVGAWWRADVFQTGRDFFYRSGNDPVSMLRLGRAMMVLVAVFLGWVIYAWSCQLFGPVGGLLSLTLFVFSPTMLAHGRLVTTDIAVTAMFMVSLGLFWRTLHDVRPALVLVSGLALGGLFVTKMSSVLFVPVALLLVVVRVAAAGTLRGFGWRGRYRVRGRGNIALASLAVFLTQSIIAVAVIWLVYGIRADPSWAPELERALHSLTEENPARGAVSLVGDLTVLPDSFLYGFAFVVRFSEQRAAFLNGAFSDVGFAEFFPYAFWAKTPPAIPIVLVLAVTAGVVRGNVRRGLYRAAPLWIFAITYWLATLTSNLNIGQRHLLPVYAVLFILGGAAAQWLTKTPRWPAVILALAMSHLAFESVAIHPHYLAYFSPLVGGPETGYRHLVDSSLDWGQDLPGLKRRLDEKYRNSVAVFLSYFGTGDPVSEGLRVTQLPSAPDWRELRSIDYDAGLYCISATMLQGVYGPAPVRWTDAHETSYRESQRGLAELESRLEARPGLVELIAERHPIVANEIRLVDFYEQHRLARLTEFLRRRDPDDHVGYSILIYELSEADVWLALEEPVSTWPDGR